MSIAFHMHPLLSRLYPLRVPSLLNLEAFSISNAEPLPSHVPAAP